MGLQGNKILRSAQDDRVEIVNMTVSRPWWYGDLTMSMRLLANNLRLNNFTLNDITVMLSGAKHLLHLDRRGISRWKDPSLRSGWQRERSGWQGRRSGWLVEFNDGRESSGSIPHGHVTLWVVIVCLVTRWVVLPHRVTRHLVGAQDVMWPW